MARRARQALERAGIAPADVEAIYVATCTPDMVFPSTACLIQAALGATRAYGSEVVSERHRHRFEFNNTYLQRLMNAGLRFSGFSRDGLVEIIELPNHPFFVASQYHPEFRSTPRDGHPLFTGFIRAARDYRAAQLPAAAGA